MAKMASLSGAVTGKLAGNVYSVNSGQQIVRAYQPNVANPNTELQVENRTKFKLASQLAAVFSPVLAISKEGLVSARNQFVSATMDAITYALGEATVLLNRLQITKSTIELPYISATRGEGNLLNCALNRGVDSLGVTKVVYCLFIEASNEKLALVSSKVEANAGVDGQFSTSFSDIGSRPYCVYAYGIIEDENSLLAKYGDTGVQSAQFIASLVSSRSGSAAGLKTTTTSYAKVDPQT